MTEQTTQISCDPTQGNEELRATIGAAVAHLSHRDRVEISGASGRSGDIVAALRSYGLWRFESVEDGPERCAVRAQKLIPSAPNKPVNYGPAANWPTESRSVPCRH